MWRVMEVGAREGRSAFAGKGKVGEKKKKQQEERSNRLYRFNNDQRRIYRPLVFERDERLGKLG